MPEDQVPSALPGTSLSRSIGSGDIQLSPFEEQVLVMSRAEEWALRQLRERGTALLVARLTLVAVAASLLIVVTASLLLWGWDLFWTAVLFGSIVPAAVAPPVLLFAVKLVARLDAAGQLLQWAALTDPLTRVMNRRGFFDALAQHQHNHPAQEVAMIDIDDFKQLNDCHGHAIGDVALCDVADWLRSLVGPAGTVARVGGDEFAYIAPLDHERDAAGRHSMSTNGIAYSVTIGTTTCHPGDSLEDALHNADRQLYQLKSTPP